jgi:hypothetical protein
MKGAVINIKDCFQPVVGTQPWKAKLGVGSFLTFEFGPKTRSDGHIHGKWHLWIYLSNWVLFHGPRRLVDSDTDRKIIASAIRRLEDVPLTGIEFDSGKKKTTFFWSDFRLDVSPADYLEDPDERDEFWMFFMPNNEVLSVGPAGVRIEDVRDRIHADQ